MNAACAICKGACCESIVLHGADDRWLTYHAKAVANGGLEIEAKCSKLTECGKCSIHETRPDQCRLFEVGGIDCRATVLRRRPHNAPEIFAALRSL